MPRPRASANWVPRNRGLKDRFEQPGCGCLLPMAPTTSRSICSCAGSRASARPATTPGLPARHGAHVRRFAAGAGCAHRGATARTDRRQAATRPALHLLRGRSGEDRRPCVDAAIALRHRPGWWCSTLFGLIAVTGLRINEAIALDDDEFQRRRRHGETRQERDACAEHGCEAARLSRRAHTVARADARSVLPDGKRQASHRLLCSLQLRAGQPGARSQRATTLLQA